MSDVRQRVTPELSQLSVVDRIDLICDAFEDAWMRGDVPQIEDYLEKCDDLTCESLLAELLLVDREFRSQRGESVSRHNYQERFPDYSTLIDGMEFATIAERRRTRPSAFSERLPVSAGARIAHFDLLERLGTGASGTVWKARDTRLRRLVAIKMPRCEMLDGSERERFLREGQMSAQLRHPNIVTVHEVGDDHGQVFIAAALIDGVDLRQRLSERHLTPQETAELAAELAEALHHAHEQGVVHRDLKPANVLIDPEGRPYITDFGLAKWSTGSIEKTVAGNVIGTPAYMSPEQARGDAAQADRRTDVYALGAVVYELLTGRSPFEGDIAAVVHQVVHDEPPPPRTIDPAIPRDLETICIKAMAKEPGRRYPSAQDMAVDLRRFLDGRTILARPVGTIERLWRQCRRTPSRVAALLLALICSIGAATFASVALERNRLEDANRRLEGYQLVEILTDPPGAAIAITPFDPSTGGPVSDLSKVVQPTDTTPLSVYLMPGEYCIEAALVSNGRITSLAEVTRIVPAFGDQSVALKQMHWTLDGRRDLISINPIRILSTADVSYGMIEVLFDRDIRQRYPGIPEALLVDARQTLPGSFSDRKGAIVKHITYDRAVSELERIGKRLPTCDEFNAIAEQISRRSDAFSSLATVEGLADLRPEWTSTRFVHAEKPPNFLSIANDVLILKGYSASQRPVGYITSDDGAQLLQPRAGPSLPTAFRGVRSRHARFVKW